MSDERKTVLQRMDALVEWTGFPKLARQEIPERRFKWLPIFFLTLATAGLVSTFVLPNRAPLCSALVCILMANSLVISLTGPMRTRKPEEFYDEREELWRARSNVFAFMTIAFVAWLGILGLGGYALWAGLTGWPIKSTHAPLEIFGYWLMTLGNYVAVLFSLLPTLHASWTMPQLIPDGEEA
jgi:hypothetical protein